MVVVRSTQFFYKNITLDGRVETMTYPDSEDIDDGNDDDDDNLVDGFVHRPIVSPSIKGS